MSRLHMASIIVTVLAATFWVPAIVSPWESKWNSRLIMVDVALAVTTALVAALCWLEDRREHLDSEKALLIKTLADAVPALTEVVPGRPLARTIPMPRAW